MKITPGNSNVELADKTGHCFTDQVQANIANFADGECSVEFLENIRGKDALLCRVQALLK